ncbi:MAG: class I SAM-dependent methyltransferase [Candidatus Omnitrophica bacterium]|nr:class I SAM-dependent methyltransferase [Candidatus Omnitrophota bacterium]
MDIKRSEWQKSYLRCENFIFYPKEECVKFLNRFVRKKSGINKFKDSMDFSKRVRGLDFGCGIGRLTILMKEFGIDSYGIDISAHAISTAKKLSRHFGYKGMEKKFSLMRGQHIDYPDGYFDLTIAESVLDSMPFKMAQGLMREIVRVTKNIFFMSLISGDDANHYREFSGEEVVKARHESGTVQCYYNMEKINALIKDTDFKLIWGQLSVMEGLLSRYKYSRYYLVLKKGDR